MTAWACLESEERERNSLQIRNDDDTATGRPRTLPTFGGASPETNGATGSFSTSRSTDRTLLIGTRSCRRCWRGHRQLTVEWNKGAGGWREREARVTIPIYLIYLERWGRNGPPIVKEGSLALETDRERGCDFWKTELPCRYLRKTRHLLIGGKAFVKSYFIRIKTSLKIEFISSFK